MLIFTGKTGRGLQISVLSGVKAKFTVIVFIPYFGHSLLFWARKAGTI